MSPSAASHSEPPRLLSRVLVLDPHPVARLGLVRAVEADVLGVSVIEARSFDEACLRLLRNEPALIVTDLELPDWDGLAAVRHFSAGRSSVLVCTRLAERAWGAASFEAGASGFLSKRASVAVIQQAVKHVLNGGRVFGPETLDGLASGGFRRLSTREMEVLAALADGRRPVEIASRLGICPATVSTYRRRIVDKLGLDTDAALTRAAIEMGLVE